MSAWGGKCLTFGEAQGREVGAEDNLSGRAGSPACAVPWELPLLRFGHQEPWEDLTRGVASLGFPGR